MSKLNQRYRQHVVEHKAQNEDKQNSTHNTETTKMSIIDAVDMNPRANYAIECSNGDKPFPLM
jgi:hypothetical protein